LSKVELSMLISLLLLNDPAPLKHKRSTTFDALCRQLPCGLLFGEVSTQGLRHIRAFEAIRNSNTDRAEDRYEMDPRAMLLAERSTGIWD
jgi:hypothetical protein